MKEAENAERFYGFSYIYENARPTLPEYPLEVILRYMGHTPTTVVDLGCGTGLSTLVWSKYCEQAVGIEPSVDMLSIALTKATDSISFINGFGHSTGQQDNSIDVVICSQSFHWMEPGATLHEVNRILKPNGIFATVDCDWPPISTWKADKLYDDLNNKVRKLETELPDVKDTFKRYDKNEHLNNIIGCGFFQYAREIVFSNTERYTAKRYIDLLMSQGSVQAIMKKHPELIKNDVLYLQKMVQDIFGTKEFEIDFSYRMRVGVK